MDTLPDECIGEILSYIQWPNTVAPSTRIREISLKDYVWAGHPIHDEVRAKHPGEYPLRHLAVATHYHSLAPSLLDVDALGQEIQYARDEVRVLREKVARGVRRQQRINSDMAALLRERLGFVVRGDIPMQEASALEHDRLWDQNRDNVIALQMDRRDLERYQGDLKEYTRQMRLKHLFESEYLKTYSFWMGQ